MEKLMKILQEIRPDIDFEKEQFLIQHNILDSFDIISIVGEINDVFDISITASDLQPVNFNSAGAMWKLIQGYKSRGF